MCLIKRYLFSRKHARARTHSNSWVLTFVYIPGVTLSSQQWAHSAAGVQQAASRLDPSVLDTAASLAQPGLEKVQTAEVSLDELGLSLRDTHDAKQEVSESRIFTGFPSPSSLPQYFFLSCLARLSLSHLHILLALATPSHFGHIPTPQVL